MEQPLLTFDLDGVLIASQSAVYYAYSLAGCPCKSIYDFRAMVWGKTRQELVEEFDWATGAFFDRKDHHFSLDDCQPNQRLCNWLRGTAGPLVIVTAGGCSLAEKKLARCGLTDYKLHSSFPKNSERHWRALLDVYGVSAIMHFDDQPERVTRAPFLQVVPYEIAT
jgi:FMN phosphatase YigB (HAD superfamily)